MRIKADLKTRGRTCFRDFNDILFSGGMNHII